MSKEHFKFLVAIYLLLIKDNRILLLRRFNTGYADGKYALVAGHADGNETIAQAMAREAKEEAGITIKPDDLQVVHAVHHISNREFIDFYLVPKKWQGEPQNLEPAKCDDLRWFALDALPDNLVEGVRQALSNYQKGTFFSEFNEK